MRRHFGVMAIVGLLAAGDAGWAQVRPLPPPPDLSGSWKIASTDGLSDSPLGDRFAVKQDASTITFTTGGEVLTYRLDDSANVRMTQTVTGETWRRVSRARFVTAALLVTTRIDAGPSGHWEDLFIVSLAGLGRSQRSPATRPSPCNRAWPRGYSNTPRPSSVPSAWPPLFERPNAQLAADAGQNRRRG